MIPDALSPIILLIIKTLILLGLGIYSVFAFVMVRQEKLMASVLEERYEPLLKILVYVHLFLSIGLILFAFVIL